MTTKVGSGRTLSTGVHVLQALEVIAKSPTGVSVKAIARALDVSLSSAYSLINSLRSEGFADVSPSGPGLYVLGSRLPELYESFVESRHQPERLKPFLEQLRDRASARVYAALWKDGDLEVAEILGRRGARELRDISKGFRGASHALALGKIWLAELPEDAWPQYLRVPIFRRFSRNTMTTRNRLRHNLAAVRQRGVAFDIEEYNEGVCCVAAPVRDEGERLVYAIAVSVPARRFKYQHRVLAKAVRDSAVAASTEVDRTLGDGLRPHNWADRKPVAAI